LFEILRVFNQTNNFSDQSPTNDELFYSASRDNYFKFQWAGIYGYQGYPTYHTPGYPTYNTLGSPWKWSLKFNTFKKFPSIDRKSIKKLKSLHIQNLIPNKDIFQKSQRIMAIPLQFYMKIIQALNEYQVIH